MGRPRGSKNKNKYESKYTPPPPLPNGSGEAKAQAAPKSTQEVTIDNNVRIDNKANELLSTKGASIHLETDKNKDSALVFNIDAQSCFDLMSETDNKTFKKSSNSSFESSLKEGSRSGFTGGTMKEIVDAGKGTFNKRDFERQRDALKKQFSKLDFLEAQIARRRTRVMSEYDGELDFDRLYERNPFYATRIDNNGSARTMDVLIDFSFSCGVDAEKINKYGAVCWAVVDLLERSGIQCNVIIQNVVKNLAHKESGSKLTGDPDKWVCNIKVKGAHEYVDTVDIARCFSTNFYRRACFHTWVMGAEAVGADVTYGLGQVDKKDQPSVEKGKLHLICDQIMYRDIDMDKIEQFIRDAL